MTYNQFKPHLDLVDYIDAFWVVEGVEKGVRQKERILPDGCVDLIFNLGENCKTDNGNLTMQSEKTYLVGTMTTWQESFLDSQTKLIGVRFKPGAFSLFYNYAPLNEVTNKTIEFEKVLSLNINKLKQYSISYLNNHFLNRINNQRNHLFPILKDVHVHMGQISIEELTKRNFVTARQLERNFKKYIGISPKEFVNIVRFQFALEKIKHNKQRKSLLEIAFEGGYYDHSHLTNEIKRYTGHSPSQF